MQMVIDKEILVNMFAVVLFVVAGTNYQEAKACVDEILENIGYVEIPKGHGRLIDVDTVFKNAEKILYENEYVPCVDVDSFKNAPTIIEADKEEKE